MFTFWVFGDLAEIDSSRLDSAELKLSRLRHVGDKFVRVIQLNDGIAENKIYFENLIKPN